ncbi:YagK/YfjJ domain-containing protein [Escherichia coli]|uniref:YagK/YfjJ domain-containing protein n=1 Tax=Escherichia coli TaxID=562 RepID=UPI003D9C9A14
MLLVNRDTWCRAGDYRAPGSLAGMIKQAWCSALGVDAGRYDTLAHFPVRPAVWLERDDDTGFRSEEHNAYQKRKHREGKRVHPTTLHYVWAREFGECKGKKHYHLMLLVNRDTWCRAGDYRAPGSLAGMIKQAWCSALGVDAGRYDTLAHFPVRPAVWLERDDDTGFQQVLERADYLAKESTKAYGTGERNFGCSRG